MKDFIRLCELLWSIEIYIWWQFERYAVISICIYRKIANKHKSSAPLQWSMVLHVVPKIIMISIGILFPENYLCQYILIKNTACHTLRVTHCVPHIAPQHRQLRFVHVAERWFPVSSFASDRHDAYIPCVISQNEKESKTLLFLKQGSCLEHSFHCYYVGTIPKGSPQWSGTPNIPFIYITGCRSRPPLGWNVYFTNCVMQLPLY